MDMIAFFTDVLPYLTGPAAAVIILMIILGAIWWTFNKSFMPLIDKSISSYLDKFDKLLISHKEDREETMAAFNTMLVQQKQNENKIDAVSKELVEMKNDIDAISKKTEINSFIKSYSCKDIKNSSGGSFLLKESGK